MFCILEEGTIDKISCKSIKTVDRSRSVTNTIVTIPMCLINIKALRDVKLVQHTLKRDFLHEMPFRAYTHTL